MAHNYILQVTAGSTYDLKDHKVVAVNTAEPLSISSAHMDIDLNVRIQVCLASSMLLSIIQARWETIKHSNIEVLTSLRTIAASHVRLLLPLHTSLYLNMPKTTTNTVLPFDSLPKSQSTATTLSSETTLTTQSAIAYLRGLILPSRS